MKALRMAAATALGVAVVACAQMVITSLEKNGNLTWTNSVSNATYRVEWASSVTGPWQKFDALTNLSLLSATSPAVTVKVPMLYRVVWLDALSPFGVWDYQGYDSLGGLLVTGKLTVVKGTDWTNRVRGLWELGYAGPARERPLYLDFGWQFGAGWLSGAYGNTGTGHPQVVMNLNPRMVSSVSLQGSLWGDSYAGNWQYSADPAGGARGPFTATRQAATEPSLPNLVGLWDYSGYDLFGELVVTGRLTIATGTNPVAGLWDLGYAGKPTQSDPRELVGQQIGCGDLVGVTDSLGRTLRFNLGASGAEGCVTFDGFILDGVYIGEWSSVACTPEPPSRFRRGAFKAQRVEGF